MAQSYETDFGRGGKAKLETLRPLANPPSTLFASWRLCASNSFWGKKLARETFEEFDQPRNRIQLRSHDVTLATLK